jgi:glycosyltransferase involved in cell wall biosynthesis
MSSKHRTSNSTTQRPRVLFVNTRNALHADVAVHLTLIQHLNPDMVDVYVATNAHSTAQEHTLRMIRAARNAHLVVCDLGQEMQGRGRLGRLLGIIRNLPVFGSLLRLALLIRREKITVLHTTDRPRDAVLTTLLGRLTGTAIVLHVHVKWTREIGRGARWAAQHAARLVCISRFTEQSVLSDGIDPARVLMAYNATDTARFDPASVSRGGLRRRLEIADDIPLVGIVGRFTKWKGHLDLVTAFARVRETLPSARLAIVGRTTVESESGPVSYVATVRERIEQLGLTNAVDWVEWTDDVPSIMADLDIMAMPSWEEPFGLVATECMSMECPVVGYASGALPEIITDGVEGVLVPPGDTEALGNALIALLSDPLRRSVMGQRGRQRVLEHFSPGKQAATLAQLYRSLTNSEEIQST